MVMLSRGQIAAHFPQEMQASVERKRARRHGMADEPRVDYAGFDPREATAHEVVGGHVGSGLGFGFGFGVYGFGYGVESSRGGCEFGIAQGSAVYVESFETDIVVGHGDGVGRGGFPTSAAEVGAPHVGSKAAVVAAGKHEVMRRGASVGLKVEAGYDAADVGRYAP